MIEVTALIEGIGSSPQWALQFRRASAIGSKSGIRRSEPRTADSVRVPLDGTVHAVGRENLLDRP